MTNHGTLDESQEKSMVLRETQKERRALLTSKDMVKIPIEPSEVNKRIVAARSGRDVVHNFLLYAEVTIKNLHSDKLPKECAEILFLLRELVGRSGCENIVGGNANDFILGIGVRLQQKCLALSDPLFFLEKLEQMCRDASIPEIHQALLIDVLGPKIGSLRSSVEAANKVLPTKLRQNIFSRWIYRLLHE